MQMWMIWMFWGVFLAVMFGLITDAVSESKGYAKSWFYAGLFLGPIGLLILLLRPDPSGQVRYVENRPEVIARSRTAETSNGPMPGSGTKDAGTEAEAGSDAGTKETADAEVDPEVNTEVNEGINTEANAGIHPEVNAGTSEGMNGTEKGGAYAAPYLSEGHDAAGTAMEEEADDSASRWICPLCGHKNLKGINWCDACGNARK